MLRSFRLGTGSCNVAKLPVSDSRVPRTNCAKIVSNGFCLSSNFTRACSRKFGATFIFGLYGFEFWKTGNTSELGKGFWNSEFWFLNFPIGWFGDFGKFKWPNFLTIFCRLFGALKLCYLVHIKILYFSQVFFPIPFMCLNGPLRIIWGLWVLLTLRCMAWLRRIS
jgi:hypothetical protein